MERKKGKKSKKAVSGQPNAFVFRELLRVSRTLYRAFAETREKKSEKKERRVGTDSGFCPFRLDSSCLELNSAYE